MTEVYSLSLMMDFEYIQTRIGTAYDPDCVITLPSGVKISGADMNKYCNPTKP